MEMQNPNTSPDPPLPAWLQSNVVMMLERFGYNGAAAKFVRSHPHAME